jgi:hypothetical protein
VTIVDLICPTRGTSRGTTRNAFVSVNGLRVPYPKMRRSEKKKMLHGKIHVSVKFVDIIVNQCPYNVDFFFHHRIIGRAPVITDGTSDVWRWLLAGCHHLSNVRALPGVPQARARLLHGEGGAGGGDFARSARLCAHSYRQP